MTLSCLNLGSMDFGTFADFFDAFSVPIQWFLSFVLLVSFLMALTEFYKMFREWYKGNRTYFRR